MITHNIGVLFADEARNGFTHDVFSAILEGFRVEIEKRGYRISFLNVEKDCPDRKSYLEQIKEEKYDGVFITCIDFHDPEVLELQNREIPMVVIDEELEGMVTVGSDNEGGMIELVRYLLEMNHKRIAYITGQDCQVTKSRLKSYVSEMHKAGIEIAPDYIKQGKFRDTNQAAYLTEALLRLDDIPTCIVYSDDYAAIGGLNVLRARGMEVPGDISVAGYDGISVMAQYEPRITTVVQNKREIGRVAGAQLLEWIENPEYEYKKKILVKTHLEKGRSVAKVYY